METVTDGHIAQRRGDLRVFSEGPLAFQKTDVLSLHVQMGPWCSDEAQVFQTWGRSG